MRGTIRQRGPDRWQLRVSLGERDPDTGRYRYLERSVRGSKREAERVLARLVTEVDRGGHRQRAHHTVTQLIEAWLAHIEAQGRSPSTLTRYRSVLKANIGPQVGRLDILKVTGAELDAYYGRLLRTGLSPLTVRKSHAMLSAAFNQALRWGWVDVNPVLRATAPSLRGREIHPPTSEELQRLLEACAAEKSDLGSLVYLAATTGGRRGELCGLRWSDVDLERATLTFARSVTDAGRVVIVKDTKTHQVRRIALDPSSILVLTDHRHLAQRRASAARTVLGSDAYVWSQALDAAEPYRPDRVTGSFRVLRDRLDLSHVTFHALRHFAATTLAAQGVPIRTIAGRLGHANPGITLRTYAHFLEPADRDAATAMGGALAGMWPGAAAGGPT